MSWMSCTDGGCEIDKNEKEGAGHWPKNPKVRKQSKKTNRKEQGRTSTSNTTLEGGQASLPNITYISKNNTLRSVRSVRLTHLTPER